MITLSEYVGPHSDSPDWNEERQEAAVAMLDKVNDLLAEAEAHGVLLDENPRTGSLVSGITFGGFRPQDCPQGAPHSAHKEGRAVDVYDPMGLLDKWITDALLARHGLYREAPVSTLGWSHLTDRAPGSGQRTFNP